MELCRLALRSADQREGSRFVENCHVTRNWVSRLRNVRKNATEYLQMLGYSRNVEGIIY